MRIVGSILIKGAQFKTDTFVDGDFGFVAVKNTFHNNIIDNGFDTGT